MPWSLLLLVVLSCPPAWGAQPEARPGAGAAAVAPRAAAAPSSVDLQRALETSKGEIEKQIASLKARTQEASRQLVQTRGSAEKLELESSIVKAMLAVPDIRVEEVQTFVNHFTARGSELGILAKEASTELEMVKAQQVKGQATFQQLRKEVERLRASRLAAVWNDALDELFEAYERAFLAQDRALGRLLEILEARKELLDSQIGLLDAMAPQLAQLKELWNAELLRRQGALTLGQQIAQSWNSLISLPERGMHWAVKILEAGTIQKFITQRPGFLIGLLCILALLLWGGPKLRARSTSWFTRQELQTESVGARVIFRFSRHLVSLILPILLALWVSVALHALEWTRTSQGRIILDTLATLIILRLLLRMNRSLFGGRREEPLLTLEKDTATFYRRNLRLLMVYTALGILGLAVIQQLTFPATVVQLIHYILELGWIIVVIRLIHPARLEPLAEQLCPPDWSWKPRTRRLGLLRGMLIVLVLLNVLAYLIGFQGLASFAIQATTISLLLGLAWAILGMLGAQILHTLLHAEHGWLARRLPERSDLLSRACTQSQQALRVGLGAALGLSVLAVWGIEPSQLLAAFGWLEWKIPLGSFHLTPLKLILAALVIYLGIGFARLTGQVLGARVFPRAGWDIGIQYTVSTILRYVVLLLVGLMALDILGFPLANLALIMGAVGVGVGLGLQSMVSNFFSGLVLLIERPIKVGDLLVIDGMWGEVKEIRIRATVFQTVDKSVLIIPNSDLTSGKILNWTHYGRGITRITLQVGVSYDSDVRQVTQILRDLCRENPRVMADPGPNISFSAYGESSLDFTVMVHVRTPEDRIPATHELNTAIFDAFKENGIEIPFPQRDLYIKNWPRRLTDEEGTENARVSVNEGEPDAGPGGEGTAEGPGDAERWR